MTDQQKRYQEIRRNVFDEPRPADADDDTLYANFVYAVSSLDCSDDASVAAVIRVGVAIYRIRPKLRKRPPPDAVAAAAVVIEKFIASGLWANLKE